MVADPSGILGTASRSNQRPTWLADETLPHEHALRAWLQRRKVLQLEVDDIVQEAYAVLVQLPSVAHIRTPRTYFFSVAHSIILQHGHRMRIVSIETVAKVNRLGILLDEVSPERRVSDHQDLRQLWRS